MFRWGLFILLIQFNLITAWQICPSLPWPDGSALYILNKQEQIQTRLLARLHFPGNPSTSGM